MEHLPAIFLGIMGIIFMLGDVKRDVKLIKKELGIKEEVKDKTKYPRKCHNCDYYSGCSAPGIRSKECKENLSERKAQA